MFCVPRNVFISIELNFLTFSFNRMNVQISWICEQWNEQISCRTYQAKKFRNPDRNPFGSIPLASRISAFQSDADIIRALFEQNASAMVELEKLSNTASSP